MELQEIISLNNMKDCSNCVLSHEGESKIVDYVLMQNDINTAAEKLGFWLNQFY